MLDGRALAALSARSAAARRRIAVAGPPGGLGEAGRAVVLDCAGEGAGESDWVDVVSEGLGGRVWHWDADGDAGGRTIVTVLVWGVYCRSIVFAGEVGVCVFGESCRVDQSERSLQ